jgi:hypothetical protein
MVTWYKVQTAERAHTWSDEGKQCCMRNSRFDQNRNASVAVRNQAPDIHARGNESPNKERRKRNGRSSRSRWRESEPTVLEDHFFTRSPPVRTSTVHAFRSNKLISPSPTFSDKTRQRNNKNKTRHTKKTLLEPNRKSRTKISPSTQTQTSSLYKTSSSLLFGIISLSLSPFVSLCAAEVHSLLVRKSLPKRKKKQNQQQQQIAANNLLFFLLLFTKRFPEIDQKNQNKIQNRYKTKMKGT